MGQSRPLFVYFCSFLVTISIQIEKSIDGVLGIRTWGRTMVGADVTTELWRPPTLVDIIVTTLNGDLAISVLRHINFAAWPAVELRCSILFQIWSNGKSNFDQHFDDPIDRSNDRYIYIYIAVDTYIYISIYINICIAISIYLYIHMETTEICIDM